MCPYFEVPCPLGKCKERMMRKEIPDHLNWKCKHRETGCEFCLTKMPLTDLQVSPDVHRCRRGCRCVCEGGSKKVCLSAETQRDGVSGVPGIVSKPLLLLLSAPQ